VDQDKAAALDLLSDHVTMTPDMDRMTVGIQVIQDRIDIA
jgi:hypothetical protein